MQEENMTDIDGREGESGKNILPVIPPPKNREKYLPRPENEELVDAVINRRQQPAAQPELPGQQSKEDSAGLITEIWDKASDTAASIGKEIGQMYDKANEKVTAWKGSGNDFSSMLDNVQKQVKRHVNILGDYTTPIKKETEKAVKQTLSALQNMFNWKK